MDKTIIILPKDETLNFLKPIVEYIIEKVSPDIFDIYSIDPTQESHQKAYAIISSKEYKNAIFLGHGSRNCLFGARSLDYKDEKFINPKNFSIFSNKNLFLVSCESAALLKNQRGTGFLEGLGFGDLPTDWNDISAAMELNSSAYKDFSEEMLQMFKNNLVDIIRYSIVDFLIYSTSMRELHMIILLRINKMIAKTYLDYGTAYMALSDVLLRMKHEVYYVQKSSL